jgi:hypothetical protein
LFQHCFRIIVGATVAAFLPCTARAQNRGDRASAKGPALANVMPYGRLADPRIASWTIGPYVRRWYLERTDPSAASSDVVHQITYLIDANVPAQFHPHIVRAVHEWDAAFDAIGLRHVLTVRDATPEDSVTPPANVVRIRYAPVIETLFMTTSCNQMAATGQMTGCDIWMSGSVFQEPGRQMCRSTAIGDPAVPLSCPDSILAFLFRSMVTHEVGHTLGLAHNFHSAIAYPTDSLASARFVHDWGFAPSIMHNQLYDQYTPPEAHVPHADRWARIGPYDRWAIAWTYRSIPGATGAEDELPTLEQWRAAQDTAAYLRVSTDGPAGDLNGAGGDDPVRALEFRERDRVAVWSRLFLEDTAATLARITDIDMPRQWQDGLIGMMTTVIGGRRPRPPYPRDRTAIQYAPVAASQQLRVVRLVLAYAVYGEDPYLRLLQSVAAQSRFQPSSPTDSVPLLFDASATSHFPAAAAWQRAQLNVLEALSAALPKLPSAALPEACHDFSAAAGMLTRVESAAASPAKKAAATALRAALAPAPEICQR